MDTWLHQGNLVDLATSQSLRIEDQGLPGSSLEVVYEHREERLVRTVTARGVSIETARGTSAPISKDDAFGTWWGNFLEGGRERVLDRRGALSSIDLFCGAGGLSLGASLAASALGFELGHEFATDTDKGSLGIFKVNHRPRTSSSESVANLLDYNIVSRQGRAMLPFKPRVIDDELASLDGSIDILLAGPPCQGHSTVNNSTRFRDPRNLLYLAVPALAAALDIPAVVIENVPTVTASREGVVTTAIELLESSGYQVTSEVLASDQLGWPQKRRRFFLVATKGWGPVPLPEVREALSHDAMPIAWALDELLDKDEKTIMTETPEMSSENVRRINFLHDNDIYDLPDNERPDCHKDGHTYQAVYGRLRWDEPAPTLTTGFMTPGRGRYIHPLRRRTLVPREAARIQGFPDTYRFEHADKTLGRSAVAKAIGEAVPSILGYAATLSALGNRPTD